MFNMKIIVFEIFVFLTINVLCESLAEGGRPLLGAPKKKRPDLGPPIYEENEVQILIDSDWDENLLNFDVYLVLFYERDCHITKSFIKDYEAAADFLMITKPYTPLAKVECSLGNKKTQGLCSKIYLRRLPIIR